MDSDTLLSLEQLNQLRLTADEEQTVLGFFAARNDDMAALEAIDTENTTRMVWVSPLENVLREDIIQQNFTAEQLQEQAPDAANDYWLVPRVGN